MRRSKHWALKARHAGTHMPAAMRRAQAPEKWALAAMTWVPAALVVLGLCSGASCAVRKTPYIIYPGTGSDMQVLWQLTATEPCTIDWGEDTTYSGGSAVTSEYGADHQHTYTIQGLSPGEICHYRVTAGAEVFTGSFRAAPPGDAGRLKFAVYGDTRTYPAKHDIVAGGIVDTYSADPEYLSMVLFMGDYISEGDYESDWDTEFFDPSYPNIQAVLRNLAFQGCMGNHEGEGHLFAKYFPFPFAGGHYYSFDYGPAHVVVVDQYNDYRIGTPQHDWIDADLAATGKPWKFMCLHEPGWSSGGHPNNRYVQDHLQPLCEEHGVQILFAGHNHYYARAQVNGVVHITAGGGGAPLYNPLSGYPYVITRAKEYSFCKVDIDGSGLSMVAVKPDGTVLDSCSINLTSGVDPGSIRNPQDDVWMDTASPSPFVGATALMFSVPAESPVDLAVFSVDGRKVRTLLSRTVEAGFHRVEWDGRDDAGMDAPPGMYFCRLENAGGTVTRKVVRMR